MRINLTDNNIGQMKAGIFLRKDVSALFPIADKTIAQLCHENENLLIFPYSIEDSDDKVGEASVMTILNTSDSEKVRITTGNVMGFIGVGNLQIKIKSRFDEGRDDYLLHYMLQKVFSFNLFDLNHNNEKEDVFDFIMFMFPHLLKNAMRQGIYREYQNFKHNDAKLKGTIDWKRHIAQNIPFAGNVAYSTREYTYDNDMTELIRHTIEFMKSKRYGQSVLGLDQETIDNVNAVCELGQEEKLMQYRMILAKTLPLTRRVCNIDPHTICSFYKKIIGKLSTEENAILSNWWKSRNDDYLKISPNDIMSCITEYGMLSLSYKLEEYVNTFVAEQSQENAYVASKALELIAKDYVKWGVEDYRKLFDSIEKCGIKGMKMQCNAIMIEKFHDEKAISWRFSYLKENKVSIRQFESHHVRLVSDEEQEISGANPRMFRCFMSVQEESVILNMIELFKFGLSLSPQTGNREYASYLMSQIYMYFINMKKIHFIHELRAHVERHCESYADYNAYNIMNHYELVFMNLDRGSIDASVKKYNTCITNAYLPIRNDADFRNYFTTIALEVQKEIQDQGIYSLVNSQALSEDFIQRELKNTIINKCCQLGLTNVRVDREVALQDNKRTDFLISYGMCNPIMIELKLLHNKEIQNTIERQAYKMKFEKYSKATNACLSVFWVFDVGRGGKQNIFEALKDEYRGLPFTTCLLTKCKCSSGRDTGAIVKKRIGKKTTRKKRK